LVTMCTSFWYLRLPLACLVQGLGVWQWCGGGGLSRTCAAFVGRRR
jgi:hypothetical protein